MCRPEFENGGLRERPLTKNGGGGFQSGPSLTNEGCLELKITSYGIFFKRGFFFWSNTGRKIGTNKCIFLRKGVLSERSRSKK